MFIADLVTGVAAGIGIDLSPDAKTAYFVEWSLGELTKLETATGRVETVRTGLQFPQDVEVDWARGDIFVSERTGQVRWFRGAERIGSFAVAGAPHQLALVDEGGVRALYVVCYDGGTLNRIEVDTGNVTTLTTGLGHPVGLAVDIDQRLAWISEQDTGTISMFDLPSGQRTGVLATGLDSPFFLALTADRTALYCVQRAPANVVGIPLDGVTTRTVALTGLDWQPSAVAVSPVDDRIFICTDRKVQVASKSPIVVPPPPKPPVIIESITFRYDGSIALPVSHDLNGAPVSTPEWDLGGTRHPVAYVGGVRPTIEVVLRRNNPTGNDIVIGATGNLGGINRRTFTPTFDASGRMKQRFEFLWPLATAVGFHDLTLDWYSRDAGVSAPAPTGSTKNRLYAVLARATKPWNVVLWAEALAIACRWAHGAWTLDDAAARVTEGYYRSGAVEYDVVMGGSHYAIGGHFEIGEMVERLNGGVGKGERVNCTDSATTVSTFANLLGADLWQSTMGDGFELNQIIAIGGTAFPFPNWGGFRYHEVAWKGACDVADAIFDGCLQVDGDADPTAAPHTPLLPVNAVFGDCSALDYRSRLSPPGAAGCVKCVPQPSNRQRRALI